MIATDYEACLVGTSRVELLLNGGERGIRGGGEAFLLPNP